MTEREDDEFREAMSGVLPLKQLPKALPVPVAKRRVVVAPPAVTESSNKLTLGHVPEVLPADTPAWKQGGVQERVFKRPDFRSESQAS